MELIGQFSQFRLQELDHIIDATLLFFLNTMHYAFVSI